MVTASKKRTLNLIYLYLGTGLVLYLFEIAFLNERQWYGADGAFSVIKILMEVLFRAIAWPLVTLFGINRLGFSAEGRYGSWIFLVITLIFVTIVWRITRKRNQTSQQVAKP